jgi:anhydro-N-acetylmuramic acid kinase
MPELFIGLMSGTSVDAIDAVLADLEEPGKPVVLARHSQAWENDTRRAILAVCAGRSDELERCAELDNRIARCFAQASLELLRSTDTDPERIRAIGCHGQTVRHSPRTPEAFTVQLGNPSLIAELCGIPVVADFRRRDMAAGGEGAPLAPAFHAAFFGSSGESRAVVNLGGFGNITLIDSSGGVTGFDTGPANSLLDTWATKHLGMPFDQDGAWGGGAAPDSDLLERMLADPYFNSPAPKSTGREYFNLPWLEEHLSHRRQPLAPRIVQSTLCALTVESVAVAVEQAPEPAQRVFCCGGGTRNRDLMKRLRDRLAPRSIGLTRDLGVAGQDMEALGFAWLARQTLAGLPGNVPAVTGARGPRILGGIYPA